MYWKPYLYGVDEIKKVAKGNAPSYLLQHHQILDGRVAQYESLLYIQFRVMDKLTRCTLCTNLVKLLNVSRVFMPDWIFVKKWENYDPLVILQFERVPSVTSVRKDDA